MELLLGVGSVSAELRLLIWFAEYAEAVFVVMPAKRDYPMV